MPKISDLPEFDYQYYTDRMYLVGNAENKSTEEVCTGTVQLDHLMESYLSTQSYYDALIPTWVRHYYLGDDAFDPFFATYLTQPSALETYFTNHNVIPTYFSVWFNDTSLMDDLFSDTQFGNYLENYVSGSISSCISGLFYDENFTTPLNDYLYTYLGSSSTFTDNLDFRTNLDNCTGNYLSANLLSFMSECIEDCLSYYLSEETNCYAIADMFSIAMSYYMSVYGPLPT